MTLKHLREIIEKATPRPWRKEINRDMVDIVGANGQRVCQFCYINDHEEGNVDFIAASRQALPAALDLIVQMKEVIDEYEDHLVGNSCEKPQILKKVLKSFEKFTRGEW